MTTKKFFLSISLLATVSIIVTSCYKDREELLYPSKAVDCNNPDAQGPKFAAVELIIKSECVSCHSAGAQAPDLSTSCDVLSEADGIYNECVVDKSMPTSAPLSSAYQAIIKDWYEAGHKYTD